MRRIALEMKVKVIVDSEDDVEVSEIVNEMDLSIDVSEEHGKTVDFEITDFDVLDSR